MNKIKEEFEKAYIKLFTKYSLKILKNPDLGQINFKYNDLLNIYKSRNKTSTFYTPKQYKEITGNDWPEDAPVWVRVSKKMDWELSIHKASVLYHQVIIANEAGKPKLEE